MFALFKYLLNNENVNKLSNRFISSYIFLKSTE